MREIFWHPDKTNDSRLTISREEKVSGIFSVAHDDTEGGWVVLEGGEVNDFFDSKREALAYIKSIRTERDQEAIYDAVGRCNDPAKLEAIKAILGLK